MKKAKGKDDEDWSDLLFSETFAMLMSAVWSSTAFAYQASKQYDTGALPLYMSSLCTGSLGSNCGMHNQQVGQCMNRERHCDPFHVTPAAPQCPKCFTYYLEVRKHNLKHSAGSLTRCRASSPAGLHCTNFRSARPKAESGFDGCTDTIRAGVSATGICCDDLRWHCETMVDTLRQHP